MGSFPNTSFHLKNEQCQLSLLEHEEERSVHEKIKLAVFRSSELENTRNSVPNKVRNSDIIAPIWKPKVPPPANRPTYEQNHVFYNFLNFLVSVALTLIFYTCVPIFSAICLLVGIVPRLFTKLLLRCCNGKKLELLPMSRIFGSVNGNHHTVILICRGRCEIQKIRARLLAVILGRDHNVNGVGKFSHLQQRVTNKFGYLCLENCTSTFDIKNHVRHFDIRTKNTAIDLDDIIPSLESNYSQPFDNYLTAPQWEMLVVPKYTLRETEKRYFSKHPCQKQKMYALIFRFQNGIMDWNMFQELITKFLGENSCRARSIFCASSPTARFWKTIKTAAACLIVGPQAFLRSVFKGWKEFAMMTPASDKGRISFATTKPISAETVEDIRERSHTGTVSILGSCVRIAIRNMALGQNSKFPSNLRVVRVFNTMTSRLPDVDFFKANFRKYRCCLERLHASFHAIEGNKVCLEGQRAFNKVMMQLAGLFPSSVSAWLFNTLMKADVVVEICPGTDEPCKLFDGETLEDFYAWSGVAGMDTNFKITVTTYCGRVRANVIGKLGLLSGGQRDAQIIANEFEEEYEQLASAVSIYPQQLYLFPAIAS